MYKFYFEKLEVWRDSKELTKLIYKQVLTFPREEKFGLCDQLKRAAVSVTANIAEGSSRNTGKDKARFSGIAYSSLMELLSLLIVAQELELIPDNDFFQIRQLIERVGNKLNALRKVQLKYKPS